MDLWPGIYDSHDDPLSCFRKDLIKLKILLDTYSRISLNMKNQYEN